MAMQQQIVLHSVAVLSSSAAAGVGHRSNSLLVHRDWCVACAWMMPMRRQW
jgi:hypothetical protein